MKERILRPDAELEIHANETCIAGTTIPAEVIVCLHESLTPREVRLELIGEETYYVEDHSSKYYRMVKKVKAFTKVPYTVIEQPSLYPGVTERSKVKVQIPIDAPPTCCGKVVDVHWKLKAILDVPGRRDQVQELPILVMSNILSAREAIKNTPSNPHTESSVESPRKVDKDVMVNVPQMYKAYLGVYGTHGIEKDEKKDLPGEKSYEDCILKLEVPEIMEAWGEISGSFQVKVVSKIQVRGIRVELVKLELARENGARDVVACQDLSGPVSLNTTESPSFTFALPLPSDVTPTMKSPNSSLSWQVWAVLDQKMRRDFNIERDVIIYNVAV